MYVGKYVYSPCTSCNNGQILELTNASPVKHVVANICSQIHAINTLISFSITKSPK